LQHIIAGWALTLVLLTWVHGQTTETTDRDAVRLSADTDRPEMSTYALGEDVALTFKVNGLSPATRNLKLLIRITDEYDKLVEAKEVAVAGDKKGAWRTAMNAPTPRLGFYRVCARLSNGVILPRVASRPEGFITYCVVPDPAERVLYPPEETFFGLQGGFNVNVNVKPYLGVRWVLGPGFWKRYEPDYPGQFKEKRLAGRKRKQERRAKHVAFDTVTVNGERRPWKTYSFACGLGWVPMTWKTDTHYVKEKTVMGRTVLTAEGERYFRDYCLNLGKAMAEDFPDEKRHLYEVTWEFIPPWGWKGTPEEHVRYYEIAGKALREADPKAFIIGPCGASMRDLNVLHGLFKAGLGKYIDGFSHHPYIKFFSS